MKLEPMKNTDPPARRSPGLTSRVISAEEGSTEAIGSCNGQRTNVASRFSYATFVASLAASAFASATAFSFSSISFR